jgi:cobalt-zinc-cadmium efflux system outer membrane protein
MTSHDGLQRVRRVVVAGVSAALLGLCPSAAADEMADNIDIDLQSSPTARGPEALTLREALTRALERSPDLAAYSWEIRAREARALQAGLLPNPTFSAELENFAGSGPLRGVDSAETTLLLSQLIELGGKRSKRRSVGAFDAKVAAWEYEAARLAVIGESTAAFVAALAEQDAVRLAAEQIRLAEDVLAAVQKQVRAGAVSSAEVPRAEVEVTNQRIESRLREHALRAAYVRLATSWGDSEPGFSSLAGDLDAVSEIPLEAELRERLASTPELERWQAEVTKRRAAVELEHSRRIPDVTLGLGPRHFNDTNDWAVVAGVQFAIPIFDRNQGARQASRNELDKSREQQRSAALRLRRALADSYQGLASAYDEVVALRDDAIPTAERAYAATKRAQRQGALRFTDVLDAQRSLFTLRTRLVAALASYHFSRAQTEVLIGGPVGVAGEPVAEPEKESKKS